MYHFNNLRFENHKIIRDDSAAHVLISFASIELMERRLLKWCLDHPMNLDCDEDLSIYLPISMYIYIYMYKSERDIHRYVYGSIPRV